MAVAKLSLRGAALHDSRAYDGKEWGKAERRLMKSKADGSGATSGLRDVQRVTGTLRIRMTVAV